jgi:hypothetical protein
MHSPATNPSDVVRVLLLGKWSMRMFAICHRNFHMRQRLIVILTAEVVVMQSHARVAHRQAVAFPPTDPSGLKSR